MDKSRGLLGAHQMKRICNNRGFNQVVTALVLVAAFAVIGLAVSGQLSPTLKDLNKSATQSIVKTTGGGF